MTCFFVEGMLEKRFLSKACPNSLVRRIGLNGDDVAIPRVVEQIVSLYRALGRPIDPVVVIFDREGRQQHSQEIAAEVTNLLAGEGIRAVVGIPDRNIEAWMLHDPNVAPGAGADLEGKKGEKRLKELLGVYSKAVDGPALLKRCRPSHLRASPSFRAFADAIDWLNCWWLEK